MPRLQPLDPPYAPEIDDALRRLMGSAGDRVEALTLFRTIAHHDVLLTRFRQIGSSLLSFGRLPAVDRELVIHRTTARCGAAYEWGVHAALFGERIGLAPDVIAATWRGGPDDPALAPEHALLIRACDELHDDACVTDATWEALRDRYGDDQLVELVCLAGFYHLVSFLCGAFAVEQEPWAVAVPVG
jgi:alkylhydroperoxidase family enzyme